MLRHKIHDFSEGVLKKEAYIGRIDKKYFLQRGGRPILYFLSFIAF